MKRATFIGLAAGAIGAAMIADTEAETERPALPPFGSISIAGVTQLEFSEAPTQSVRAIASAAVLKRLSLTVTAGVLHVGMKSGTMFHGGGKPRLMVTAPRLDSVTVSGVASGTVSGLTGTSFRLAIRGTGSMIVTGAVARADLIVSGAGTIDARKLVADDLRVDISGAGSMHGYARRSADVAVSGVGSATIAGDPPSRRVSKSGVGSVSFE